MNPAPARAHLCRTCGTPSLALTVRRCPSCYRRTALLEDYDFIIGSGETPEAAAASQDSCRRVPASPDHAAAGLAESAIPALCWRSLFAAQ